MIIYVPSDFTFDRVIIDAGAGKVNIEELSTKELYLSFGAGKAEINNLEVLDGVMFSLIAKNTLNFNQFMKKT